MDRHTARRGSTLIVMGVTIVMVLVFSFSVRFTPASAGARVAAPLCGDGSAPNYGFTYDLQQAHWTVDWQNYASEKAVTEVDAVLDRLNADFIAQTMILIKSQAQVGNRVNCAVHFLRYMKLGLPEGERKDNGFVFLIVVEPTDIDVHYGVGLGLPALTAPELTTLNRTTEATYQSTHSLDEALLTLVQEFDTVARNKYAPLISPTPTPGTITLPALPSGPLSIFSVCGMACLGVVFLLFLLWMFIRIARKGGIRFNPSGSGSRGMGSSFGGGRSSLGGGRSSSGGGSRSSSPSRGGSGSGRSGRGN